MSLEGAIEAWINANHPKIMRGVTKVVTKQNKAGKQVQTQVTEKDPLYDFLIENVSNGTVELLTTGRILFPLTRHESLCQFDALTSHMNGKVYRRAAIKADNETVNWSQYEPYIVQHKRYPSMLFCVLTNRTINKTRADLEAHTNGSLYKRAKKDNDELEAKALAKKEKVRAQKAARRALSDRFNTPGTDDSKYDFSNMDFGAMMENFGEGGEGDDFDFDGEGEFSFDSLEGFEGEMDDLFMDEDDEEIEFEEEEEEEEEKPIVPLKKGKQAIVPATAPVTTKKTPQAPAPVAMLDDEDDDEDFDFEDEDEDVDYSQYDFDGMEDQFGEDGEGEDGTPGMIDGEGEFIPGIWDEETNEFVPGVFTENGHFMSFEDMESMMDGEGEFDSDSFFDEDEDDDIEIDVFDENGDLEGEDEDEDFVDDDDDDDLTADADAAEMMKQFALLKKQREQQAQKGLSVPTKATGKAPAPAPTKTAGKAAPAPAPAQPTKRKPTEQLQPTKKNAPLPPQKQTPAPKQQKPVQLPSPAAKKSKAPAPPPAKKGGRK